MATINKGDLIEELAAKKEISKRDAGNQINSVLTLLTNHMIQGDTIRLINFGTFDIKEHSAHNGRNPQTGEKMLIPAHKVPHLRISSVIKKAIE